jgi:hypothetical protein
MIEIGLSSARWEKSDQGQQFLPLGVQPQDAPSEAAKARILRRSASDQHEDWGTLGPWDSAAPLAWQGQLRLSLQGDEYSSAEQSGAPTIQLIEHVQASRTATVTATGSRVRERFIDLSSLDFGSSLRARFPLEEQPSLQLTLFLRPDEGALVALQYGRYGENGVEFIQPEPTPGHTCSARDRLKYRIPLPLEGAVDFDPADSASVVLQGATGRVAPGTSIKVLTFQRGNSTSSEVIARALGVLGRDKYALLKWDLSCARFVAVEPKDVRHDAKTLLLLHGTFSSTKGSFGHLAQNGNDSWLSSLVLTQRRYGQVLAFDHDTVLHGLERNASELQQRLGGALTLPVDILTHSRGGLLGKQLAIYGDGLQVERAAMTACANGVGYFRFARGLSRFLTVLYRLSLLSTVGSVIVSLAQHSIDAVLGLDGLQVMIPGSKELLRVAQASVPAGRTQTVFLPIVGDYRKALAEDDRMFRRLALGGLDLVLKGMLGAQHDWVVGTAEQRLFSPGSVLKDYQPVPVPTWHTTYYDHPAVRDRAWRFLALGA